jgi:hypothetical protein
MAEKPQKIPVVFYRTRAGSEVVRNWLRGLDEGDRNAIGQDLMRVQYRWPIGMPLCRSLGAGLSRRRKKHPRLISPWRADVNVNSNRQGVQHEA